MQVGAKLALGCRALHGGDHAPAYHQRAHIRTTGLLDELLYQKIRAEFSEGINHGFGCFRGLRKDHTAALGTFQQLEHNRSAAHQFYQVAPVLHVVREAGHGHAETLA